MTLDIDPIMEWYYKLLFNLFSSQINSNNNLQLLSDENLEYLVKEHIFKDLRIEKNLKALRIANEEQSDYISG